MCVSVVYQQLLQPFLKPQHQFGFRQFLYYVHFKIWEVSVPATGIESKYLGIVVHLFKKKAILRRLVKVENTLDTWDGNALILGIASSGSVLVQTWPRWGPRWGPRSRRVAAYKSQREGFSVYVLFRVVLFTTAGTRYAVATLPRTGGVIAHKWHTTRTRKPGRSAQTYFSFPSPRPSLTRMRTRKNTAGLRDYIKGLCWAKVLYTRIVWACDKACKAIGTYSICTCRQSKV